MFRKEIQNSHSIIYEQMRKIFKDQKKDLSTSIDEISRSSIVLDEVSYNQISTLQKNFKMIEEMTL